MSTSRKRGAHKGVVRKRIAELGDMIDEAERRGERPDPDRLRQLRQNLREKVDILGKLDEEILDGLQDEAEMMQDIEDADTFREAIYTAISRADAILGPSGAESESSDGATAHRNVNAVRPKLPELTLARFEGDVTAWTNFWDSYESAVHNNAALSEVDKFTYLRTLVGRTARDAIEGLPLTAANYAEAVEILQKRFGNKQLIISKHMDILLGVDAVSSVQDITALRRMYDKVEAHVRGLKSLGVTSDSYGALLAPVLQKKIPPELRLVVNRELTETWDLDRLMKTLAEELDVRERSLSSSKVDSGKGQSVGKTRPTSNSFMTRSQPVGCVYCQKGHASEQCRQVSRPDERKQFLRGAGRCFICLKRGHLSNRCHSRSKCTKCAGLHHVSICNKGGAGSDESVECGRDEQPQPAAPILNPNAVPFERTHAHTTLYTGGNMEVLLQTAQATVFNPLQPNRQMVVQLILDGGSHRSYVTERLRKSLNLKLRDKRMMSIATFGSFEPEERECHVVDVGLLTKSGSAWELPMLTVPMICDSFATTPVTLCLERYPHLRDLDPAEMAQHSPSGPPEVLIGSDHYWQLVTGNVIRGCSGPVAMHTQLGWVLTGPVSCANDSQPSTSMVTFSLRTGVSTSSDTRNLERELKSFWELESLGIVDREQSLYDQFKSNISLVEGRYEVSLPWRSPLQRISLNYQLSLKRLKSLLRRLRQDPQLLNEYDSIIREQLNCGIIEIVDDTSHVSSERVHYLPHHAVVRRDKATTKVRVVYDASAKSDGCSLNECLHVGPKFGQRILELLIRFRVFQIALVADIEKAFLMISIAPRDRDVLRFLWVKDVSRVDDPEVQILRFKRVVFGVASSPFLLNATVRCHLESYEELFPCTVPKVLRSMYVDDMVCGGNDENETYQLYLESKDILEKGGFKLRKFITNCPELQRRIDERECLSSPVAVSECKVLGVGWNVTTDQLVFDPSVVFSPDLLVSPTKRSVVRAVSRFYDPLGILSPVIITFKIFLQELATSDTEWDEPLTECLLERWKALVYSLQRGVTLTVPRVYLRRQRQPDSYQLCGFSDASISAYAAVVYLIITQGVKRFVSFVAAKTRVAPKAVQTIPRLELIGALLLSRLMNTVTLSLKDEIELQQPICYTDSKVALYWIYGLDKDWKPFIQNRAEEIRSLIPPSQWNHCPGSENPADAPSRGVALSELAADAMWLNGPAWLTDQFPYREAAQPTVMPGDCAVELRAHERRQVLSVLAFERVKITRVIEIERYSRLDSLLSITSYVLKFIQLLKNRAEVESISNLRTRAEILWIAECQRSLAHSPEFVSWKSRLGLFIDDQGIWRCGGRLSNANISYSAKHPVLLNRKHPFTVLVVQRAHERVLHNGVKETLAEIRSKYWIVKGRSFVRQILFRCTVCKRFEALPYRAPPPPPLPPFRVLEAPPFTFTGVDFAGPLYVKPTVPCGVEDKVWICLFTCAVVRAVHLEVVINLSVPSFLRCLKRFIARRGLPQRIVSDNGKTFKGASKVIKRIVRDPEVLKYLSGVGVSWQFNVERAPWWGGMFERMVGATKRCLRKMIGQSRLSYDELNTAVIEVEMVINSRPISYISSDDLEEPLTPSHLMTGRRLLSLPDNLYYQHLDEDYVPEATSEVLTRRMKYLTVTLDQFWRRWSNEYLLGLRESHAHQVKKRSGSVHISVGDIVVLHDEKRPRGFWKLGKIEEAIPGRDGSVRSAVVRVFTGGKRSKLFRRPVQLLYPIEIGPHTSTSPDTSVPDVTLPEVPISPVTDDVPRRRSTRGSAFEARDKMLAQAISDT